MQCLREEYDRLGRPLHRQKLVEPAAALAAVTAYFEGGQQGPGTHGTAFGDEEDDDEPEQLPPEDFISHFTCSNNFADGEWYLLAHGIAQNGTSTLGTVALPALPPGQVYWQIIQTEGQWQVWAGGNSEPLDCQDYFEQAQALNGAGSSSGPAGLLTLGALAEGPTEGPPPLPPAGVNPKAKAFPGQRMARADLDVSKPEPLPLPPPGDEDCAVLSNLKVCWSSAVGVCDQEDFSDFDEPSPDKPHVMQLESGQWILRGYGMVLDLPQSESGWRCEQVDGEWVVSDGAGKRTKWAKNLLRLKRARPDTEHLRVILKDFGCADISTQFHSISLNFTQFHSIPLNFTQFHSILLYFTLLPHYSKHSKVTHPKLS